MKHRTILWSEGGWGLWEHEIPKIDRGSWGKYMLFHDCGIERDHRVRTCGDKMVCVRCVEHAPDGAIALLKLMNWDDA